MNNFEVIEQNKNLINNPFEINEAESTFTVNGVTYGVNKATVSVIAEAFIKAKEDSAVLNRLNNLFDAKQIQSGERLNNMTFLCVKNDFFGNWIETSESDDFDTATYFALVDLKAKDKSDYYNVLMSPDNPNVFCNCYSENGVPLYEVHYYKSKNEYGLICSGKTFEEVIGKYEAVKDELPTPITLMNNYDIANIELSDGVVIEVKQDRKAGSIVNPTDYQVRLVKGDKVSDTMYISGEPLSILNLRDGKIDYEEFGLSPDDIVNQADVIQSDIKLKIKDDVRSEEIQDIIAKSVMKLGDEEYSKWICLESDASPYQISFRVENPKHCSEDQLQNIDFQIKHKLGAYVGDYSGLMISSEYIARTLSNNSKFNSGIYDDRLEEDMQNEGVLDILSEDLRIEDMIARYISFPGDCIEIHLDEFNERNAKISKESTLSI
ncbi:hypothetical protein AKG60_21795 [Vibrio parahaemolyticus]|uniref:Uncharacterized protein n=1 Tax=Vibrio parahaemolyticus TaxID=670 RepID=A0AAX0M7V9_VIBPH|nr:hypothetical protein [Vibrio parahaemolyticus]KOF37989.1 hypothetical protein ACX13_01460 [Vibrio parahaemolyticus]MCS0327190.1 hypothetical protein [Vibrio diabolicus]MCS0405598.1 hypothetical protein [Vibrio diabolicus]OQJ97040.1 hypothetical protein AKG60_21795 [Vibrio parahaemolyticus]